MYKRQEFEGRSWYIRLLLAVAGLSRVVEWWEAERGFWNFDGEDMNESLNFVLKPTRDGEAGTPSMKHLQVPSDRGSGVGTPITASSGSAPISSPGLSCDHPTEEAEATARPESTSLLTSQIQAAQDLKMQAEHNKSINIVVELSLGGEIIEWVNPAWHEVTG